MSVLLTGALFQYNIGEYGELTNTYACGNPLEPMPNASAFDAPLLNVSEWMEAVASYGGKCKCSRSHCVFRSLKTSRCADAVLTVQAGCGFDLWPSNVSLPSGGRYNYTVRESRYKHDLLRQFVDGARAAGIKPGIYYIVNNNILLSRVYNATPAQTEAVVLGQLREIWSGYGDLVELCAQHIPPSLSCLAPRARSCG